MSARTAAELLTDLRLVLTHWETALAAMAARHEEEGSLESARCLRAKLDTVHDVFGVIGR